MSLDANLREIQLALSRQARHARLFYNPVGQGWTGRLVSSREGFVQLDRARPVTFGLAPGSSDLVGLTTITVTQDMVGQPIAVFTAAEVKNGRGRLESGQLNFVEFVRKAGGFADVVRTPEEAIRLVRAG